MKTRLCASIIAAGTALILVTGCVSSRKYKTSQADLAKARGDSAQLAQQVSALNGNVHDLQDRNTTLQHSLDSSSSNYAAQQKSLDYYQSYFKEQQDTLAQVSQDVKGALTQAGISNADVQQTNTTIYVRLDENELFKKNSMVVTPVGRQVLDAVAQVIVSRSNVNVAVSSGDSAIGWVATDKMDKMPADAAMNSTPRHHKIVHASHRSSSTANSSAQNGGTGTGTGSVAASANGTGSNSNAAPAHKKVHHKYSSEGSTAIYSGPGNLHNHAWALKQGRMVTVANHFLKSGLPKVNLSLQQPPMNGTPQSNTIKIIIMPAVKDFNPQNSSAALGTR
jgi:outer membrane protein OmpA-like peptidoglycan-associated protein